MVLFLLLFSQPQIHRKIPRYILHTLTVSTPTVSWVYLLWGSHSRPTKTVLPFAHDLVERYIQKVTGAAVNGTNKKAGWRITTRDNREISLNVGIQERPVWEVDTKLSTEDRGATQKLRHTEILPSIEEIVQRQERFHGIWTLTQYPNKILETIKQ